MTPGKRAKAKAKATDSASDSDQAHLRVLRSIRRDRFDRAVEDVPEERKRTRKRTRDGEKRVLAVFQGQGQVRIIGRVRRSNQITSE